MRRGSIFWGVAVMLLGVFLLLNTLGLLHFNWGITWGGFLILLGVWVIWSRSGAGSEPTLASDRVSAPLEGAARVSVRLHHGAGQLTVRGGTEAGMAFDGFFVGGLSCSKRRKGDTLELDLRPPDDVFPGVVFPGMLASRGGLNWTMSLTDVAAMSLEVETGASEVELDLSRLRLSDLAVKTGASSSTITLPATAGSTSVRLDAGAASLTVRVPDGVAALIRAEGLGSIAVDTGRFPRHGGVYQSAGYDTAMNRVDLRASVGLGSLTIR